MNQLQFLTSFVLLLAIGAFFIIGFYIITRGERTVQPDGTQKVTGKILRRWSLFWEQTNGVKLVYFRGRQLLDKFYLLHAYKPELFDKLDITEGQMSLLVLEPLTQSDKVSLAEILECQVHVKDEFVFLYKEEPIYRFPEIIRYPLSQCPPCMASVGGTFIYWSFVLMTAGDIVSWGPYQVISTAFWWIIYCVALSSINKLVHRMIELY